MLDGKTLHLEARFPDYYPYTRFEVIAPDLNLRHHQNPIFKNVCLLGRASHNWEVTDKLADFITNRLPIVIRAGNSEDESVVVDLEEHQGEPLTDYYPYLLGASLLVDSEWQLDKTITEGELVIGTSGSSGKLLRGAILEIRDANRITIAQADVALRMLYKNTITGIWIRCQEPPTVQDAQTAYASVRRQVQNSHCGRVAGRR